VADTHSDAHDHGEYHHGDQNPATQIADFRLFAAFTKWFSLFAGALILMLTLWFCTSAGFLGGLVPGLIVLAIGVAVFRNKPQQVH
jgi:thiamine transporter ThiT